MEIKVNLNVTLDKSTQATIEALLATANKLEGKTDKAPARVNPFAVNAAEDVETEDVEIDEPVTKTSKKTAAAKPAATSKKKAAVEEESFDLDAEGAEEDEAPVVTKKDLIAACRDNREAAIKALKKMKVNSVDQLKPAQYATVLAAIGA
jgi:hypothetical protein